MQYSTCVTQARMMCIMQLLAFHYANHFSIRSSCTSAHHFYGNTTNMVVLNTAQEMTPFASDLPVVETLYSMHDLQTIYALFFNQAQASKIPILNFDSLNGYIPTPTGADSDVFFLIKKVHQYSSNCPAAYTNRLGNLSFFYSATSASSAVIADQL